MRDIYTELPCLCGRMPAFMGTELLESMEIRSYYYCPVCYVSGSSGTTLLQIVTNWNNVIDHKYNGLTEEEKDKLPENVKQALNMSLKGNYEVI